MYDITEVEALIDERLGNTPIAEMTNDQLVMLGIQMRLRNISLGLGDTAAPDFTGQTYSYWIKRDSEGNVIYDSRSGEPAPGTEEAKPASKAGSSEGNTPPRRGRPKRPAASDELKELVVDSPPLNEKGLAGE